MADQSFLGTGWGFPPFFSKGGAYVAMVAANVDIEQSLQIILGTRLGDRIMLDGFGCGLDDVLFEEMDQNLVNTLTQMVQDAILYHEPRINLEDLDVSESANQRGLLLIRITYRVRNTNSRFNMVYPFYINEAHAPGAV